MNINDVKPLLMTALLKDTKLAPSAEASIALEGILHSFELDKPIHAAFIDTWQRTESVEAFVKQMVKLNPQRWQVWSMAKQILKEEEYETLTTTFCRQSCSRYFATSCKDGVLAIGLNWNGDRNIITIPTGGDETDTRCVTYLIDAEDRLEWSPAYGTLVCHLDGCFSILRKNDRRSASEAIFDGKYDLYRVKPNRFVLVLIKKSF